MFVKKNECGIDWWNNFQIASLTVECAVFVGAKGGAGGKGNIYFADSE